MALLSILILLNGTLENQQSSAHWSPNHSKPRPPRRSVLWRSTMTMHYNHRHVIETHQSQQEEMLRPRSGVHGDREDIWLPGDCSRCHSGGTRMATAPGSPVIPHHLTSPVPRLHGPSLTGLNVPTTSCRPAGILVDSRLYPDMTTGHTGLSLSCSRSVRRVPRQRPSG